MKKFIQPILLSFSLLFLSLSVQAQNVGDTIKVKTFHYGSNTRDTVVLFPDGSKTYEKIIMRYNMRCKNALVSDQTNRNLGCGEWDYSCNTYIVDSSKVEEALNNQANYVISNFTGNSFAYTTKPVYDYYQYTQQKVTLNSISSDTSYVVSNGNIASEFVLKTNQKAGKSQFIYLASELTNAGFSAGPIQSLILSIANTGGKAGFLKVSIKHTDSSNTNSAQAELTGFTEVYSSDYFFVNGSNRIVFKTPFTWNGTQNIIVQFSFTNSLPNDSAIQVVCAASSTSMGLTANQIYAADLSNNGHFLLDTSNFSTIKNELTLSFWAFGNANQMPANTSVLYATDNNPANRQLNIHLPFSNNNVYFDCGFAAGGYDRINKAATAQEQGGQWNHWVFTKSAIPGGVMKIFVNGNLWFSGTGKTKAMNMQNMILGKDINLVNNYKGKITDFAIFNKAMPDSLIETLMNKSAVALTDLYSNLVAYYPMNEGSGQTITENKLFNQSAGTNISWSYDRGDKLMKGFMPLDLRPRIEFTRGVYNTTIQTISVRDSIKRNTTYIEKYSIQSKAGIVPLTNDIVKLDSSFNTLYSAASSKVYNGDVDTLAIIDSIPNTAEGTLLIQNLPYYKRFPWYNEIMSFVTPYGIGLDLGATGKTWFYDVTDFAPLLKGSKRIVMTLGGQSQEQNDIEFWFVVGTPPRTVLEFNQIWQGTNRTGSASIGSINNQSRFAPVNVPILPAGKAFKLRSSITGHGSEGEFEANGGPVLHSINIDNDTAYKWSIVQLCAFNPIFPQGGTWIYDRQGWCPGQSSLLKENNLTSKLVAGKTASIDYNTSLPVKAGGAYNFQVAHQLVTYGNPNFSLDARIVEVKQPSDKILYGRSNPMCSGPKIKLQNSGSTPLTSVEFSYWINDGGQKQSYTWTGSLAFLDTINVNLPIGGLYAAGMLSSNNVFKVEIVKANGVTDGNSYNNLYTSGFKRPEVIPGNFLLDFRTNNNPTESAYELYDGDNKLVDSKTFATANTLYTQTYALSGCYRLVVYDAGEDGLSWWGNTAQGNGFVRFRNPKGSVLKTLPTDFGSRYEYSFTTDFLLSNQELEFGSLINLFPNPSTGNFVLEGKELENATVKMIDLTGRELAISTKRTATNKLEVDAQALPIGVYLVVIEKGNERVTKKVMIQ